MYCHQNVKGKWIYWFSHSDRFFFVLPFPVISCHTTQLYKSELFNYACCTKRLLTRYSFISWAENQCDMSINGWFVTNQNNTYISHVSASERKGSIPWRLFESLLHGSPRAFLLKRFVWLCKSSWGGIWVFLSCYLKDRGVWNLKCSSKMPKVWTMKIHATLQCWSGNINFTDS